MHIHLIHMVTILIMSAKMAALGVLKINVFLNKVYGIIASVHDVTNRILSHVANYFVDVVL